MGYGLYTTEGSPRQLFYNDTLISEGGAGTEGVHVNGKGITFDGARVDVSTYVPDFGFIARDAEDSHDMTYGDVVLPWDGQGSLTILHWSDTHSGDFTTPEVINLMGDGEHDKALAIFTGDAYRGNFTQSNSSSDNYFKNSGRFMMCAGNHDVYERPESNKQHKVTSRICLKATDGSVFNAINWGGPRDDEDNSLIASYCYRDIDVDDADGNNKKLRIIVLDQYETDTVGLPNNISDDSVETYAKYDDLYSQEQISWFISTLKSMHEDGIDYFIVVMHEPPSFNDPDIDKPALRMKRRCPVSEDHPDPRINDFCSCTLMGYDTHNGGIWPPIIDAYLNRTFVTVDFDNFHNPDDEEDYPDTCHVHVEDTFADCVPAKFLFYMCGHIHREACIYLPFYPDQLMLCIDCATWKTNNGAVGDLERLTGVNGHIINKITLDFANRKTTVKRIGANYCPPKTYDGTSYPELTRDEISFNFTKVEGEDIG